MNSWVKPRRIGQILRDFGFLHGGVKTNVDLTVDPSPMVDPKALEMVPETFARDHRLLPLAKLSEEFLFITREAPSVALLNRIRSMTRLEPVPVLTSDELDQPLRNSYARLEGIKVKEVKLGTLLLNRSLITPGQLEEGLAEQKKTGEKLGQVLINKGFVTEDAVYTCLAEQLGHQYKKINPNDVDLRLMRLIPRPFAERLLILPLRLIQESREIEIAMADPDDLKVKDILSSLLREHGFKFTPILAPPAAIWSVLRRTAKDPLASSPPRNSSGNGATPVSAPVPASQQEDFHDLISREDLPEIRRLINQVLYQAVEQKASDIHIENLQKKVRVRLRIDGLLQEFQTPINKENINQVISVLKIDSGLDITEHRRPQDGVFTKFIRQHRQIDFRISVHCTPFGGDAVLRVLDCSSNLVPLKGLGFPPEIQREYLRVVSNPQGLVLITGPTGSGKSTTLYSTLSHLNTPERKIVTAEDPIEYQMDGICQYQVNESIGNSFAEYGRRFLRKDPDIILVGEIRDPQTAEACVKAAMTGHLVFSTLHTNDSVGVVSRLCDLGIELNSIAHVLLAVVSQRLVRRVCPHCTERYNPEQGRVDEVYEGRKSRPQSFLHGKGCERCHGVGYAGRVGLYELWRMTTEMRNLIMSGGNEMEMRQQAIRAGLKPLMEDALQKVAKGITTVEELIRVVPMDQLRLGV